MGAAKPPFLTLLFHRQYGSNTVIHRIATVLLPYCYWGRPKTQHSVISDYLYDMYSVM